MTEFENEYKQIKKKCEELERSNKEKEQLITKMSKDCKQIRDNF